MPTTLKQIAKHLDLSITQVSRALGGYADVSAATRARVQQAALDMGYVPNVGAQRLQKRRTDAIGLVLPTDAQRFSDPFFSELIAGIGNEATQLGYDLLLSAQPDGPGEMQIYERFVRGRRVDGLLIARTRVNDERIRYLIDQQFPFVAFGRSVTGAEHPWVEIDSYHGVCEAAEHLLALGHRSIGFVSAPPDLTFAGYRLAAYLDTLRKHGINPDDSLIAQGDLTQAGGYAAAMRLLQLGRPPTAIMTANDLMALGAMSAIQTRGYRVGADVSVLGFDGISLGEHSHPPLTTAAQPVQTIASKLTQMLVQLVNGQRPDPPQVLFQPTLIVRESTRPPGNRPC